MNFLIRIIAYVLYYPIYLGLMAYPLLKEDLKMFNVLMLLSLLHLVFVVWQKKNLKYLIKGSQSEQIRKSFYLFFLPFVVYSLVSGLIIFIEFESWAYVLQVIKIGVVAGALPFLLMLTQVLYHQKKNIPEGSMPSMEIISLTNYKDKVVLKVAKELIIYIESRENNIFVYFEDNNEVKSFEMRQTLKSIEKQLEDCEDIFKVHKSFLVNKKYILSITGRSQSQRAKLMKVDFEVPISRNFDTSLIY